MVQYIITPWRSQRELFDVREALYSPSAPSTSHQLAAAGTTISSKGPPETDGESVAERRRHAVDRVAVWMHRGNCPHLVESTALLVAARLDDERGGNAAYAVRAAYGAAFARFVTGLLDSHQTATHKKSMYALAKTLSLPATFVELRHQVTHESLPSLPKLKFASQKALEWIYDHYWIDLKGEESNEKLSEEKETERKVEILERLLKETDEGRKIAMERKVAEWGSEELTVAFEALFRRTTDPSTMLRATELSGRLLSGGSSEASFVEDEGMADEHVGERSLEDVKRQLAALEQSFSDDDEEEEESETKQEEKQVKIASVRQQGKGWEMWNGEWIPTPIGTIS